MDEVAGAEVTGRGGGAAALRSPVGILACSGVLPLELARATVAAGRPVHIVAIEGSADPGIAAFPHAWAGLGQVGRILGSFHGAGCREMVIAGGIERPDLRRLKLDIGFVRHLPTVLSLTRGGDDSVLRRVVRFFEGQGFIVRGVGEIAPSLLAGDGALGNGQPSSSNRAAIGRARRLIEALGPFDVGQAVVATANGIVAIEGVRGTDAMLAELTRGSAGAGPAIKGVLVKASKPGQELRVDLPTIGLKTMAGAIDAGLDGVAIGAGTAIVLDREEVRKLADTVGLFVVGFGAEWDEGADPDMLAPAPPALVPPAAPPIVHSRRAPTPSDRRDIGIARRLMPILRRHQAGRFAVVAGEHVLGVAGALPVEALIASLSGRSHWGRHLLRDRIGTLAIDVGAGGDPAPGLTIELFRAAMAARLAGIVCLGGPLPEAIRTDCIGWANEAKVFLMAEASP